MATIFFKWLYPKSTICSFEPDKETYLLLEKNIKVNNLKKVYTFNKALSNKNGKIDFYIDSKQKGSLVMSAIPQRNPSSKLSVESISLSKLIEKEKLKYIDLIKMDIEGLESFVIEDLNKKEILKKVGSFCRISSQHWRCGK